MKILYVTTIGSTMTFFKSFIKDLTDSGNQVDIAANTDLTPVPEFYNDLDCKVFKISCTRSPLNFGTVKAIKQIIKLVAENQYDIVHCHTPIAAMCTRLACMGARKKGTKVIYTAHGFHFYKGAPLKNWLMFYPIEKICSLWTDILITINKEDYELAKNKFKAKRTEYVPGVGIDIHRFADTVIDKSEKRKELGVPDDCFMLLSVGEHNKNKNHEIVIRALASLKNDKIHYVIAGRGILKDYLENLARELHIENQVHLIGFREDVAEIYKAADVYLLPSIREGLNVSVMEAMSSGLPCIVSDIRGNRDMIDETCGYLCNPFKVSDFSEAITNLIDRNTEELKNSAQERAKMFNVAEINEKILKLYK